MLKQRVITAIIALPFLLYAIILGPQVLMLALFAVFVALATYETASLTFLKIETAFSDSAPKKISKVELGTCIFVNVALLLINSADFTGEFKLNITIFIVLMMFLVGIFFAPSIEKGMAHAVAHTISVCYGCFPWLLIWQLYTWDAHGRYLLLLLAIVWGGDTAAYFGGRFFGRRKLAPHISPKKTVEGAIFGILGSVGLAFLVDTLFSPNLASFMIILSVSCLGGIFAQLGDLIESSLKRFTGVKDSGKIFPGHGGFLDRIDGLLFSAPVVWLILYFAKG